MENKFTKGDWQATNKNHKDFWDIDGECRICSIDILGLIESDGSREEAEANAKLISAAPKMYEALQKIYNIENTAFGLNGFDVERLKSEILATLKAASE